MGKFMLQAIAATFLISATAGADAPAPSVIGVFDMQRAIQNVSEGKKAHEQLKKEVEDRQKKLQAEGKKVQDMIDEFNKKSMVMDEKSKQEQAAVIQQKMMAVREMEQKAQADFQQRDRAVSTPIINKLREIVAKLAKEKGYTHVFDGNESAVIYMLPGSDLTDEAIKRFDGKK